MNRREAILRATALMGGTLSVPLLTALVSCETKSPEKNLENGNISAEHSKMISEIAELIIPKTDTPGAKDAMVPEFIEMMLKDCYYKKDSDKFYKGLDALNETSQKKYSKSFLECKSQEQTELLLAEEKKASDEKKLKKPDWEIPFILMMKELTLFGFFTSEIGATQAQVYVQVPGAYKGCIDMEPGQKAWAL